VTVVTDKHPPIKVVEILDDRELALNAGTDRGIILGTVLRIVSGSPTKIVDPDTDELLGEVVHTKAVVRVYEVQTRFSLARTFRTRRVNVGGSGSPFGRIFEPARFENRVETLRRSDSAGKPLSLEESVVSIGDIAEVIESDDVNDIPSTTVWR